MIYIDRGDIKMGYSCVNNHHRECDGCMACRSYKPYYCPICGEEVYETVFVDNSGNVLGCENCAQIKEPHEVLDDEADE